VVGEQREPVGSGYPAAPHGMAIHNDGHHDVWRACGRVDLDRQVEASASVRPV